MPHMRQRSLSPLAILTLCAAAVGQTTQQDWLVTFSQVEASMSGSGGTPLQQLLPNEIHHLDWNGGSCNTVSAEKWLPRTGIDTMAGDEDADGTLFAPFLFDNIDALVATWRDAGLGRENQRTVFWSPAMSPFGGMGTAVCGPFGLRPGDVGRIVRNGFGDGRVEYFMPQEEFNRALGLPLTTPIDIDAIAFSTQVGVLFSLDNDITITNGCGSFLVRDGDVIGISNSALSMTADLRVVSAAPASAFVIHTEAAIGAMITSSGVADRFGSCVSGPFDLEALEIDWNGPGSFVSSCSAVPGMWVPTLLFTADTMTGGSVLSTAGGGTIHGSTCGLYGRACPLPTLGDQVGIRPTAPGVGAASYINGLVAADTGRYVLQPRQHLIPMGAPAGFTSIDVGSPFPFNFIFLEAVSSTVPASFPGFGNHFPDIYVPSALYYLWTPAAGGFGTFPTPGLPALWTGKVLFQSVGFSAMGLELSTPAVLDVQ
jgi:hypothetical protein